MPPDSEKIIILESVESTNNYAMALIQNKVAISGNGVFAYEQTRGKGQRGKEWKANAGKNITLSIIIEMQWLTVSHQFRLSVAAALGCYDFVSKYINEKVCIKWPNDIFINDSKAGGILIENVVRGTLWQWAVMGFGINVNQTNLDEIDKPATSFKKITGKDYDLPELLNKLHECTLKRVEQLHAGFFQKMLEEYNQHLYARDKKVKFKKENIIFEATIKNVSESGQLVTQDIFEKKFDFGEVEMINY